MICRDRDNRD